MMGIEVDFCIGCGQNVLGFNIFIPGVRESPCTYYDDKSREFIIDSLAQLDDEHLNAVLAFYGFEPIKTSKMNKPKEEENRFHKRTNAAPQGVGNLLGA